MKQNVIVEHYLDGVLNSRTNKKRTIYVEKKTGKEYVLDNAGESKNKIYLRIDESGNRVLEYRGRSIKIFSNPLKLF